VLFLGCEFVMVTAWRTTHPLCLGGVGGSDLACPIMLDRSMKNWPPKRNSLAGKLLRGEKVPRNAKQVAMLDELLALQHLHETRLARRHQDLWCRSSKRMIREGKPTRHILTGKPKHRLGPSQIRTQGNPMPIGYSSGQSPRVIREKKVSPVL